MEPALSAIFPVEVCRAYYPPPPTCELLRLAKLLLFVPNHCTEPGFLHRHVGDCLKSRFFFQHDFCNCAVFFNHWLTSFSSFVFILTFQSLPGDPDRFWCYFLFLLPPVDLFCAGLSRLCHSTIFSADLPPFRFFFRYYKCFLNFSDHFQKTVFPFPFFFPCLLSHRLSLCRHRARTCQTKRFSNLFWVFYDRVQ